MNGETDIIALIKAQIDHSHLLILDILTQLDDAQEHNIQLPRGPALKAQAEKMLTNVEARRAELAAYENAMANGNTAEAAGWLAILQIKLSQETELRQAHAQLDKTREQGDGAAELPPEIAWIEIHPNPRDDLA